MKREVAMAWSIRLLAAALLAGCSLVGAGELRVAVDLGSGCVERPLALPGGDSGQWPILTFKAGVTVRGEGDLERANAPAPCSRESQERRFGWAWDRGGVERVGGGGEQDDWLSLRYLPGQFADMMVIIAVEVRCGTGMGTGESCVTVMVPRWEPNLPVTAGEAEPGLAAMQGTLTPVRQLFAASGVMPPQAIHEPGPDTLVVAGQRVFLEGVAWDLADRRAGAETSCTKPQRILPSWIPPAKGRLEGGTVDAAGRRRAPGVVWYVGPTDRGAVAHECPARPLPDRVGAAAVSIGADSVDELELASATELGSSIDPLFHDEVAVHVVDARLETEICCLPRNNLRDVRLAWVLGPELAGLGGRGSVTLTGVPDREAGLEGTVLAVFNVDNGRADAAECTWSGQRADGTAVSPGTYTFTLDWTAQRGGRSATVQDTATIRVRSVTIANLE